jgi:hypothetical protein
VIRHQAGSAAVHSATKEFTTMPRNPFVQSALAIIAESKEIDVDLDESDVDDLFALDKATAQREPMLSPFNRQCASPRRCRIREIAPMKP